jgi:hypothetical protein
MAMESRAPLLMRLGHITEKDYCDECHRLLSTGNGDEPVPIGEVLWRFWPMTTPGKILCDSCARERDPLMMSFVGIANLIARSEGLNPLSDEYLSPNFVIGENLLNDADALVDLQNCVSDISSEIYAEMGRRLNVNRQHLIDQRIREQAAGKPVQTFYMRKRSNYRALRDMLISRGFYPEWYSGFIVLHRDDEFVEIKMLGGRQYEIMTDGASEATIDLILDYATLSAYARS